MTRSMIPGSSGHRNYYAFAYRLDRRVRWLLYYSDEQDGFELLNGQLRSFESLEALSADLRERGIALKEEHEEVELFDLDSLGAWLSRPRPATVNASGLLDAWNALSDAATSIGETLCDRDDDTNELYDRLFHYGGPAWHTGRQEGDVGDWTPEEVQRLAQVIGRGLSIFRAALDPKRA